MFISYNTTLIEYICYNIRLSHCHYSLTTNYSSHYIMGFCALLSAKHILSDEPHFCTMWHSYNVCFTSRLSLNTFACCMINCSMNRRFCSNLATACQVILRKIVYPNMAVGKLFFQLGDKSGFWNLNVKTYSKSLFSNSVKC